MSKFRGRAKRWKRKIRNARWRELKKWYLLHGWVEVGENTLVPASQERDYEKFIPTHLRGNK